MCIFNSGYAVYFSSFRNSLNGSATQCSAIPYANKNWVASSDTKMRIFEHIARIPSF